MNVETLERYYKSIPTSNDHFHQAVLDYLDYIRENKELWAIVKPLDDAANKQYGDYKKEKAANHPKNKPTSKIPTAVLDDAFNRPVSL